MGPYFPKSLFRGLWHLSWNHIMKLSSSPHKTTLKWDVYLALYKMNGNRMHWSKQLCDYCGSLTWSDMQVHLNAYFRVPLPDPVQTMSLLLLCLRTLETKTAPGSGSTPMAFFTLIPFSTTESILLSFIKITEIAQRHTNSTKGIKTLYDCILLCQAAWDHSYFGWNGMAFSHPYI